MTARLKMDLPVFFSKNVSLKTGIFMLDEATSRHCFQVLRMQAGQCLLLTDGKGNRLEAEVTEPHRKQGKVRITRSEYVPPQTPRLAVGISFIKNNSRMEWFLEKATEIGIHDIYPLLCQRTEREKFRMDRFENILSAAMLQSQRFHLPVLHAPIRFEALINEPGCAQTCIAHCGTGKKTFLQKAMRPGKDSLVLIGPEGDFTNEEIEAAGLRNFQPVSLGASRLRTETAGVVACTLMNAIQ